MYRKYINNLIEWKNNKAKKPLIVWGARQVGKTYLIKNIFAEKYFKNNYIYVDCRLDNDFVNYCKTHLDPKDIINYLSLDKNKVIDENVLLIFDEVQECLPIITALKYFNQDYPEIPVIATGSMVRIKIKRINKKNEFLFPIGKINQLTIYPMNFEEFLYNRNNLLYNHLITYFADKKEIEEMVHEKLINCFYEYLLIGGMPEVVDTFIETNSYQKSIEVLKELYDNYLADMELYQASPESIIRAKKVFENIYVQLNKETKNFKSSLIEKKFKSRDLMSPIDWLTTTFLVNKSKLLKEKVTIPLIDSDESLYRLYLSDIGMFSYQSGINAKTFISKDGQNSLSGIFFENYVATELINNGYKLFYWKGKNNSEFEFLIQIGNNIVPIDVKKGKGKLNSLDKYKEHNKLDYVIKVSSNKYGYDEKTKILTIPFYSLFLVLKEVIKKNEME